MRLGHRTHYDADDWVLELTSFPQSWNRYDYTGGTPLVATDPLGLMTLDKSCLPTARLGGTPDLSRPSSVNADADGDFGPSADSGGKYSGYDFGYSGCAYLGGSFAADGLTGLAAGAACGSSGTAMCGLFSANEDANEAAYAGEVLKNWTQYTINDPHASKTGVEQEQTKNAAVVAGELACEGEPVGAVQGCILDAYKGLEAQSGVLEGGNYNFSYAGLMVGGRAFDPTNFSDCPRHRCGEMDSLHFSPGDQTFHVDTANPLVGVGALFHFLVDVVAGNWWLSGGIPRTGPGH